ncbi:MAG TPA: NAD(P)H-hydrate dehydratase [Gemmatimonadaceae bacterium]
MSVRVVTAAEAAARDTAAIAAGTPSRALMRRAGAAAADVIHQRCGEAARNRGVAVLTGPGNNGGDGWVVAGELARRGLTVRVHEVLESRTDDAKAEHADVLALVTSGPASGTEGVVIDALLGTGARGELAGPLRDAVAAIHACRQAGATIVALDVPTGVDANAGAGTLSVIADLTVSFGTIKRGHLVSRGACGTIVVVDIGLGGVADLADEAPSLVDETWVATMLPRIAPESHKGIRRRVVIGGGARGMAGAVTLAGRAALRSGVGMVRLLAEEDSLVAVQIGLPEATAATWPMSDLELGAQVNGYAHAVLLGPGLGRTDAAAVFLRQVLTLWRGPVVLDADALNLFAADVAGLAFALDGRAAMLTPHANELARLTGVDAHVVAANRFDIGCDLARSVNATVLLKGVPTVIFTPDGGRLVSASGTPVLAAAGSGDVLGGIAVTLLAQTGDPVTSAAIAAWIHGRAAELANAGRTVRGVTLDDVLTDMGRAWDVRAAPPTPPILVELPRVGDRP